MSHAKGKLCNLWLLRNLRLTQHTDTHTYVDRSSGYLLLAVVHYGSYLRVDGCLFQGVDRFPLACPLAFLLIILHKFSIYLYTPFHFV